MAGIYLHIPFCKKACYYCDFHFSTSLKYKPEMLQAMKKELALQKDYLSGQEIQTLYFGGGTPSILDAEDIQSLMDEVNRYHSVAADAEITLEANPDDLTPQKVKALRRTPVNRFSIGIQSFFDEDLRWMNRAHTSAEADSAIKRVQDAGFENITADLIYGYPLLSDDKWKSNMHNLLQLDIPHLSAYSMTVEPRTALASFIRKGKQQAMNDAQSSSQFLLLSDTLTGAGFEHYEISNFARPGRYSQHNTNYWRGVPYLGIGPSAHSFNGISRQWTVANNARYMEAIEQGRVSAETELLTIENRVNEYIMTSLRTIWGMNLDKIHSDFGTDHYDLIINNCRPFFEKSWIEQHGNVVRLTQPGKLFADHIAAELFV
ncbi:radical SAM family heme chaperone HemW (plasmid) [Pedobacter sp. BS3]|uniref:radical SAM family heme chaperone HemW n=1 Tax=Pedobacter sp. BS3 TaxID=2567937 RepID=UPI0011EBAADB|nr:radical SAM family heme chaperone HemW [Pedobacter sp. BS3]TZF86134.1 radical SAM family heme chaperone HemW [Pedobacter sp. BS3]